MHAQGPPGTGKTRTLLALLEVLARIAGAPGREDAMGPILACADTNAATDNIVEGLLQRGINVVRLGQPAKVHDLPSLMAHNTFECADVPLEMFGGVAAAGGMRSFQPQQHANVDMLISGCTSTSCR